MPYVHDPKQLISGSLSDGTASGTFNIYTIGSQGDPNGNKVNSASLGVNYWKKWGAEDGNLIGHMVMDLVNSGTVPLFASASSVATSATQATASIAAVSASVVSLQAYATSSSGSIAVLSRSIDGWTASGTYTGSFAPELSGMKLSISGAIEYIAFQASATIVLTNQAIQLATDAAASATDFSQSLYGVGIPGYTGNLSPWVSGAMQTLTDLSTSYYVAGSGTIGAIPTLSKSLVFIAETFLGTQDLNQVSGNLLTGSYPTGSYNNLRTSYYSFTGSMIALSSTLNTSATIWNAISSSFNTLSGNLNSSASIWNAVSATVSGISATISSNLPGMAYLTSSNWTPDGGFFNITGGVYISSTLAVSPTHAFGNGVLNVSGNNDGIHVSVTYGAGSNFFEGWTNDALVAYWDSSGNIGISGSLITTATLFASGGLATSGGKVTGLAAGVALGDSVEYTQWLGTSQSLAAVSQSLTATIYSALLSRDPTTTSQYTASYTGSLVKSEVWKTLAGALIKSSSYSYTSASLMSQSFVSVFDAAGATIVAQVTSSYFYSGTVLVSASLSRSI